jgi:cytidylate kinase
MSSWNIMREFAKKEWYDIYEFEWKIARTNNIFDKKLDLEVRKYWKSNNDFVFESRLARYFIPDSYKIYLKCDTDERYNRIKNREKVSINEAIKKTQIREKELEDRYYKVYPDIEFPPNEEVFSLIIDVTDIKPNEIVDKIMYNIWISYMNY